MKNFCDCVKEKLESGATIEDLEELLKEVNLEYQTAEKLKKKRAEEKKKAEEAARVKKELSTRAAEDIYKAYEAYFKMAYPNEKLPKDAKDLFIAELTFIDYMMTRKETDYDDVLARLFKNFF